MIDTQEIFNKNLNFDLRCDKELQDKITNWILTSSKEIITEVLKEAANNSQLTHHYYDEYESREEYLENKDHWTCRCDGDGIPYGVDVYEVNKESITSVINKVKF